jgi:hypothetical protein
MFGSVDTYEEDEKALEEYHRKLRTKDKNGQILFLKSGYIPDHTKLLIDAGLLCVGFMEESDMSISRTDAATARLEAIVMKLHLKPSDYESAQAIKMFEKRLAQYKRQSFRTTVLGLGAIFVAIVAIIFAIRYFTR